MLFLEKKNESIVCVGNWAQALHFIEQQISTCTVVATSVPSSLSPDQSVLHPVLSLAYQCSQKCPLLVVFKSNQDPNWGFLTCPTSQWVKLSKSLQALREGTFAVLKSLPRRKPGSLHWCFVPPIFIFLGERRKYMCDDTGLGAPLCREVSTQRRCLAGNRWRGWVFLSPLPVAESLSHAMSHDLCPWSRAGTGMWARLRRGTGCSDPR